MASKTDIWMPLYIGDYMADTSRLTTEQHGAYLLLMMDYWRNGPLPNQPAVLAQISRLSIDAWSIAQAQVVQFFSIGDDGLLHHKRIDHELSVAGENQKMREQRARKAAQKRWGDDANAKSIAQSMPGAMLEQCPSPSPSPSPSKEQKNSPPAASKREPIEAEIDLIYQAYPRKKKPADAAKAIRKAVEHLRSGKGRPAMTTAEALEFLKERTATFAASPAGQQGNFTPYPASWFNAASYLEDENEWNTQREEQAHGNRSHRESGSERQQRVVGDARRLFEQRRARRMGADVGGNHAIYEARA